MTHPRESTEGVVIRGLPIDPEGLAWLSPALPVRATPPPATADEPGTTPDLDTIRRLARRRAARRRTREGDADAPAQ